MWYDVRIASIDRLTHRKKETVLIMTSPKNTVALVIVMMGIIHNDSRTISIVHVERGQTHEQIH